MGTNIYGKGNVTVTRYAGPERKDGGKRVRFQITTSDGYCTMSYEEFAALAQFIRRVENGD